MTISRLKDRVVGGSIVADDDDQEFDNIITELNTHTAATNPHTGSLANTTDTFTGALTLDGDALTTQVALDITVDGLTTGGGIKIDSTSVDLSARNLLSVINNATATGACCLYLKQDSTGLALNSTGAMAIAATKKFYLDGGGDTYLVENSANNIQQGIGGVVVYSANATDFQFTNVNLSVQATKKLYLDGGGDTYLVESAANVLDFYSGNENFLKATTSTRLLQVANANWNFALPTTGKLYLDGGGDSYIVEGSANEVACWAGGTLIWKTDSSEFYIPSHSTTANAANAWINSVDGVIRRSTSSIKYKENIENLEVDTEKIYELRPVSYDDKATHKGRYIGLIAEEVLPIIPELVQINEKTKECENVTYDRLAVLLLAEIQKLKTEIDELKQKVK